MPKVHVRGDKLTVTLPARIREKIADYPDVYEGFAVITLLDDIDACAKAIAIAPFDRARIPRIAV